METQNSSPTLQSFSLAGRTVVLTGGAGIYGRGLAVQLAEAGAQLILAARNLSALEEVAASLRQRGYDVHARVLDQDKEESIFALRDRVLADFGKVDGLVNNAVGRPVTTFEAPLSAWDQSMRTNATGIFAMCRAFGDVMAAAKGGNIVNVGSIQGVVGPDLSLYEGLPIGRYPDYFFHKAGMVNLTRFLAAHYGPHGLRVNCVSPGGFYTNQNPIFVERYCRATYLGRMAKDGDLGGPIVFLLSSASAYITGANLTVDGGYTAH